DEVPRGDRELRLHPADDVVVRPAADLHAVVDVADGGGTGRVRADVVLDDLDTVGPAGDLHAVVVVARDDVGPQDDAAAGRGDQEPVQRVAQIQVGCEGPDAGERVERQEVAGGAADLDPVLPVACSHVAQRDHAPKGGVRRVALHQGPVEGVAHRRGVVGPQAEEVGVDD